MSDLTPEETLQAEYYDENEPYQGRHVPLSSALAAVAAERERTLDAIVAAVRFRGPGNIRTTSKEQASGDMADFILRLAREGDTT